MPRKSSRRKQKFPSELPGYISPRYGETLVQVGAEAPESVRNDIRRIAQELGYRSTQKFLLALYDLVRTGVVKVPPAPKAPQHPAYKLKKELQVLEGVSPS